MGHTDGSLTFEVIAVLFAINKEETNLRRVSKQRYAGIDRKLGFHGRW